MTKIKLNIKRKIYKSFTIIFSKFINNLIYSIIFAIHFVLFLNVHDYKIYRISIKIILCIIPFILFLIS